VTPSAGHHRDGPDVAGGPGCTPTSATLLPLYPALALVFGSTAASSVSTWLLGSSSPFYNLSMIGMIAMILWALTSVCRPIARIEATATTCEIPVGATSTSAGVARVAGGRTAAVEQDAL
jgi:hypothetical protein